MQRHDVISQNCLGDQEHIGQFLYLEGHEYLMYNTYDVHFYASFALLLLWPQLEFSLQDDILNAIMFENTQQRLTLGEGIYVPRKVKGCVPHDIGSPNHLPWTCDSINAYNFQDVSNWKDLGPKCILQIYRNYTFMKTKNYCNKKMEEYLKRVYPILQVVFHKTLEFDINGDDMIENSGFPDQTYDIWIASGM